MLPILKTTRKPFWALQNCQDSLLMPLRQHLDVKLVKLVQTQNSLERRRFVSVLANVVA